MGGILSIEDSNNHVVSITPKDGATGDRTVIIPDSVPDLDTANNFGGNIEASSMTIGGKDVYNEANILGAVSQVGGVPTGAIIERGSNANGEYVKYADGTLICSRDGLTMNTYDSITKGLNIDVTFPATFATTPIVNITPRGNSGDWTSMPTPTGGTIYSAVQKQGFATPTTTTVRLTSIPDPSVDFSGVEIRNCQYLAVGRWY